jgi:heme-degrading monooxygenase HmoA
MNAFCAISKFVIANKMEEEVKVAFLNRAHLVDGAPGFLRMEVLRPIDRTEEFWLLTFWSDQMAFNLWHRSHQYHDSHKGIPKGLKLVPGETTVRRFELICS